MSKVTLASQPFWLDGGYDREAVEACPYHPDHRWWEFRLGDVLTPSACHDPDERMVICRACFVPRCGHAEQPSGHYPGDRDPCLLPRHHRENHRMKSGLIEPVGGWRS